MESSARRSDLKMAVIDAIAETRVPITLGGRDYVLVFNVNTFVAFEKETGAFFLDTVTDIMRVVFPSDLKGQPTRDAFSVLRTISMERLRAVLWAALHEYDENDVPHWPL